MRDQLSDLAEQQLRINEMQAYIAPLVIQCRLAGHSWAAIGRALGTTKQAAQRRFGALMIQRGAPASDGP